MRSGAQLQATPREWAAVQKADRQRQLASLLEELDRSQGADWYRWVLEEWRTRRLEVVR